MTDVILVSNPIRNKLHISLFMGLAIL